VIVEFFNLVFGEDERSDDFWEHAMPIHLRLKYGPFAFSFSATEGTNLKYVMRVIIRALRSSSVSNAQLNPTT
jgi:hypothetical protein